MGGGEIRSQMNDQPGEQDANDTVGQVEGQPFEAEYRGPLLGRSDFIEIMTGKEDRS